MDTKNKIAVCVPIRNENPYLVGNLVRDLKGMGYCVIVADDSDHDLCLRAAVTMGAAFTIDRNSRRGIGPSLMQAWELALSHGFTRIVQMDLGSHDPAEIERLISVDADVVVGSRFCRGARYHGRPLRALMSRIAALACNFAHGALHTDWTSGYRAFTPEAARTLLKSTYGAKMHGWQIEVLATAGAKGLSVAEVPISYTAGKSAFNWKIAFEAIQVWLEILHHKRKK